MGGGREDGRFLSETYLHSNRPCSAFVRNRTHGGDGDTQPIVNEALKERTREHDLEAVLRRVIREELARAK